MNRQHSLLRAMANDQRNLKHALTGWSEGGLAKAVVAIAAADADIKGAASDPIYALEQAVMTVSAAKSAR